MPQYPNRQFLKFAEIISKDYYAYSTLWHYLKKDFEK